MASYACNGRCNRHPCYSAKRLMGIKFRANIDAVCRKCEAYFKGIKDKLCPCCKQRLARHTKKGRSFKEKVFTAFADFWRLVLKQKKQYEAYRKRELKRPEKSCILCNSPKTSLSKGKYPMWIRFLHGWVCSTCYNRERYRQKVSKRNGMVITLPYQVPRYRRKSSYEVQGCH